MMNRFNVNVAGVGPTKVVSFEAPTIGLLKQGMAHIVLTPERAIELACWIIASVDPDEKRFDEIIRQIEDG